jgi:light-regulated signal transduction histidine kinase (bacteriophytochrome)
LTHLAISLVAILHDENPDRDITFNIEPGMEAKGDPRLLQVALENLFGNAVKFSSKMPKSIIDFGWDKEKKAWFVRDNGAGFDMSYAAKLFNAFNRLHGDKDFQGSGIGLATVARVVQRHQGKVWADSTVNRGATFWFTLG